MMYDTFSTEHVIGVWCNARARWRKAAHEHKQAAQMLERKRSMLDRKRASLAAIEAELDDRDPVWRTKRGLRRGVL